MLLETEVWDNQPTKQRMNRILIQPMKVVFVAHYSYNLQLIIVEFKT